MHTIFTGCLFLNILSLLCKLYESQVFGVSNGISYVEVGYIYIQSYIEENIRNAFFSYYMFLSIKDILLNTLCTAFRIDTLILDTMMEGNVSQTLYLGPRFFFMKCKK